MAHHERWVCSHPAAVISVQLSYRVLQHVCFAPARVFCSSTCVAPARVFQHGCFALARAFAPERVFDPLCKASLALALPLPA
jgi:hypothetical protein